MEIYKVIVVDDESVIRNGLCKFTSWQEYGFEVVGAFPDGKDAIEYLQSNPVDLIITDIKMVNRSGLDIAEYVSRKKLSTVVVLLSGYRDFEYAQQAIRFGVTQYLLKPFEEEELNRMLVQTHQTIQQMHTQEQEAKRTQTYHCEILPLIKQEFFRDLYLGMLKHPAQFRRRLTIANLQNFENNTLFLLDITIRNFTESLQKYDLGKERLKQEILKYISEGNTEEYYVIYSRSEKIKLLIFSEQWGTHGYQQEIIEKINHKITEIRQLVQVDMDIVIEQQFQGFQEISDYCSIKQENALDTDQESTGLSKEDFDMLQEQFYVLVTNLFSNEAEGVKSCLDKIEQELCDLPRAQYNQLYILLVETVNKRLAQANKEAIQLPLDANNQFDAQYHKSDVSALVHRCIFQLAENFQTEMNASQSEIVQKVQRYIDEHYQMQITLEDISNVVYLSSSYISRIFKQTTGITVMEYVISCRIKNAIKLLKTGNYKIFEISEMVGYSSVQYFTRQFKAETGFPPKRFLRKD